jgi:ribosome-binding protein aMBF1 (putative translation factor)
MVRKAREKRGLSQRVLAQTLKIDVSVIRRLEVGRMTPDFELVSDLTVLFRLPLMNAVYGQRVSKLQPDHDPTWDGSQHSSEVLSAADVDSVLAAGNDEESG